LGEQVCIGVQEVVMISYDLSYPFSIALCSFVALCCPNSYRKKEMVFDVEEDEVETMDIDHSERKRAARIKTSDDETSNAKKKKKTAMKKKSTDTISNTTNNSTNHGAAAAAAADLDGDDDQHEVVDILARHGSYPNYEYHVQWAGEWKKKEDQYSWVSVENLGSYWKSYVEEKFPAHDV
jgi:hypothetical protein